MFRALTAVPTSVAATVWHLPPPHIHARPSPVPSIPDVAAYAKHVASTYLPVLSRRDHAVLGALSPAYDYHSLFPAVLARIPAIAAARGRRLEYADHPDLHRATVVWPPAPYPHVAVSAVPVPDPGHPFYIHPRMIGVARACASSHHIHYLLASNGRAIRLPPVHLHAIFSAVASVLHPSDSITRAFTDGTSASFPALPAAAASAHSPAYAAPSPDMATDADRPLDAARIAAAPNVQNMKLYAYDLHGLDLCDSPAVHAAKPRADPEPAETAPPEPSRKRRKTAPDAPACGPSTPSAGGVFTPNALQALTTIVTKFCTAKQASLAGADAHLANALRPDDAPRGEWTASFGAFLWYYTHCFQHIPAVRDWVASFADLRQDAPIDVAGVKAMLKSTPFAQSTRALCDAAYLHGKDVTDGNGGPC